MGLFNFTPSDKSAQPTSLNFAENELCGGRRVFLVISVFLCDQDSTLTDIVACMTDIPNLGCIDGSIWLSHSRTSECNNYAKLVQQLTGDCN